MDNVLSYSIINSNSEFVDILKRNSDIDTIILYSIEENIDWNQLFNTELKQKLNFLQKKYIVKIVVNDTCTINSFNGIDIIKIPTFLLKTVYRINKGQETNPTWNFNSNKSLILTGKSHEINRIGFLVECVKKGILKNQVYSFFSPKEKKYLEQTKTVFNEICDWDYDKFVVEYENNPDNIDIRNNEEDMHYSGFPYSVDLFKNTSLSIVLETNLQKLGENNPAFTEKTYKAIINKHPFLILNQPNSLCFLKKYGFYTFEDYFEDKEYDLYEDLFQRNEIAVQNLQYFLKNCIKNNFEINQKIEHNYNLMLKIHNDFSKNHPDIYKSLSDEFFHR